MNPFSIINRATGLTLLMAVTILAVGCASGGSSGYGPPPNYGYYGGYYPGYDPYYRGDVIVNTPPPPPPSARPPTPPPHVSQLPARPIPAPAPRPAPRGGGRGR